MPILGNQQVSFSAAEISRQEVVSSRIFPDYPDSIFLPNALWLESLDLRLGVLRPIAQNYPDPLFGSSAFCAFTHSDFAVTIGRINRDPTGIAANRAFTFSPNRRAGRGRIPGRKKWLFGLENFRNCLHLFLLALFSSAHTTCQTSLANSCR